MGKYWKSTVVALLLIVYQLGCGPTAAPPVSSESVQPEAVAIVNPPSPSGRALFSSLIDFLSNSPEPLKVYVAEVLKIDGQVNAGGYIIYRDGTQSGSAIGLLNHDYQSQTNEGVLYWGHKFAHPIQGVYRVTYYMNGTNLDIAKIEYCANSVNKKALKDLDFKLASSDRAEKFFRNAMQASVNAARRQ